MYSISFQDDISMMPRERLMREGAEKLSNQELLSIFLRTGNKKFLKEFYHQFPV